jgi:hypothetical protein
MMGITEKTPKWESRGAPFASRFPAPLPLCEFESLAHLAHRPIV